MTLHPRPLSLLRLLVLWGALTAPRLAGSEPAPIELVAQTFEATNLHLADHQGAINFRRQTRLHFTLYPDGRLRGEESGERRENNLYRDRSTQDESVWRQSYRGRWSSGGSTLHPTLRLELERGERSCQRRQTENSQPPGETLPCASVSPKLVLSCDSETLVLSQPDAPPAASGAGQPQEAWRCVLAAASEVGDSRLPWIFGKRRCIQTSPAFHGAPAVYRPCPK